MSPSGSTPQAALGVYDKDFRRPADSRSELRTEALAAAYSASGLLLANLFRREEEDVIFPLVVSFGVKMIDEVG